MVVKKGVVGQVNQNQVVCALEPSAEHVSDLFGQRRSKAAGTAGFFWPKVRAGVDPRPGTQNPNTVQPCWPAQRRFFGTPEERPPITRVWPMSYSQRSRSYVGPRLP